MSNIKETIKAEIERLKKCSESAKMEWIDNGYNQNAFAEDCRQKSFDHLLSFIDSLPEEFPPYCTGAKGDPDPAGTSDLEEAAKEYMKKAMKHLFDDSPIGRADDAFKAGAEWHEQQMMKEAVEGVVYRYESYQKIATAIIVDIPREILGNKVKIIIVKK